MQKVRILWSALQGKARQWVQLIINSAPEPSYTAIEEAIMLVFSGKRLNEYLKMNYMGKYRNITNQA